MKRINETPEILFAKKTKNITNPEPGIKLYEHLSLTFEIAHILYKILESQIRRWLRLTDTDVIHVKKVLLLAAIFHDLGKANSDFQSMLIDHTRSQYIRHEIWSVLLLRLYYTDWLNSFLPKKFVNVLFFGIIHHHLKADNEHILGRERFTKGVTVYPDHQEIKSLFDKIFRDFKIQPPDFSSSFTFSDEDIDANINELLDDFDFHDESDNNFDFSRILALVRAIVFASDRCASANFHNKNSDVYAEYSQSNLLCENDIQDVLKKALSGKDVRVFQDNVQNIRSRVGLVRAGCGNGKTLAAYMWAQRNAIGKKLFFCYPTTGTASEGFKDYLNGVDSIDSLLLHSRSIIDIERMFSNGIEDDEEKNTKEIQILEQWNAKSIVCTVDQVLGILTNYSSSLALFPSIFQGAFVFDEIHMYDRRLFGHLLTFLKEMDHAPVLLMTASLPDTMKKSIQAVVNIPDEEIIYGEDSIEDKKRYQIFQKTKAESLDRAVNEYNRGGRVLWVANTVERCRKLCFDLKKEYGIDALCYHSRFRYDDRVDRHNDVIRSFKSAYKEKKPVFAVTTQVCEVSLDISASFLVSDLCPFSSLIQRLGRLNRVGQEESSVCDAYIIPYTGPPYIENDGAELKTCRIILSDLDNKEISQNDLARSLESVKTELYKPQPSIWMSTDWESITEPLRSKGHTIDILLRSDVEKLKKEKMVFQLLKRFTIPMPLNGLVSKEKFHHISVVDDSVIDYSPKLGGAWKN